ncbi:MAG: site-specific integrase [Verrucomicrobiales bacterium]
MNWLTTPPPAQDKASSTFQPVPEPKPLCGSNGVNWATAGLRNEVSMQVIFDLYEKSQCIKLPTIKQNLWAMSIILKTVFGRRAADVTLSQIDHRVARQFQDQWLNQYLTSASKSDADQKESRGRSLRTSNSWIKQARSIFGRNGEMDMIDYYTRHGVEIPSCVESFRTCKLRYKSKDDWNIPPNETIDRMFLAIESLKDTQRDLYVAFWFAVGGGLRRSEIQELDWSHIIERGNKLWICGGRGKNGRKIDVPLQSKAAAAIAPFRQTSGPVFKGAAWQRKINHWLTIQGFQTEKKIHELRSIIGSKIYQLDPVSAKEFLRHSSISTTEKHYVRYGLGTKILDVL